MFRISNKEDILGVNIFRESYIAGRDKTENKKTMRTQILHSGMTFPKSTNIISLTVQPVSLT